MKYDELKDYDYDPNFPFQSRGRFYIADEVEAAIEELKAENERLEKCCKEYDIRQRIDERIKFNGAKKLRATKRALWLARGYIMTLLNRDFQRLAYQCNNDDYKRNLLRRRNRYYELSEKCLKKAEEYK